ncbi:PepSY-associated TM helix domain-containing protein [Acetobacter indonesiensis]
MAHGVAVAALTHDDRYRVMRFIVLCHRWVGGIAGLLLAVLGLSGALLVHKDLWTVVSHKGDAVVQSGQNVGRLVAQVMTETGKHPQMIAFASPSFGVDRVAYAGGAGAYLDQTGQLLTSWSSDWARPELWLVTLHRYLFMRPAGETVVGIAGFIGLALVILGCIAWWRTRQTFEFRLWPKRMSRPAIIRQHRDLGIVMTPVLLLSFITGVLMVFRPLGGLALGPGAAQVIDHSLRPPHFQSVKIGHDLNWQAMMETAREKFPQAEFRSLALPRKGSGLITIRMRQPSEWLPNGRTMLWFAADTGQLVEARDATLMPVQARAFNDIFPLHTGKVGGIIYKLLMTLSGLTLALLGFLATWTFWFAGGFKPASKKKPQKA